MAAMLEALEIAPGQHVLEIGTGTGYNAALMAHLVEEAGHVTTLDLNQDLLQAAQAAVASMGLPQVEVRHGNGLQGYEVNAPYDRIMVTGGFSQIASLWVAQLRTGGKLVVNLLLPLSHGIAAITKTSNNESASGHFLAQTNVAFMQLRERETQLQPIALVDFPLYDQQPLVTEKVMPPEVVNALNDPTFLFYLQWHCPSLLRRDRFGAPENPTPIAHVLLDPTSYTSLSYEPKPTASRLIVRGQYNLWSQVYGAYQQWNGLGRPALDAYVLSINQAGRHHVRLPLSGEEWEML